MTRMYGHKWISSYGEVDDGTWAKGLSGMSSEQLGAGLRACLNRDDPWPPTLVEFRNLCAPPKVAAPYHRSFGPALPAPQIDPKKVADIRRQIREKVGL